MNKRSVWFGSVSWLLVLSQLALVGCGEDPSPSGGVSTSLKGRVFSADDGKALQGVTLGLGKSDTQSDARGAFEIGYDENQDKFVIASGPKQATTTKKAPEGGGYVELFSKEVELEAQVDLTKGAQLKTESGLQVKIAPGSFKKKDGSPAQKATVKLARADLTKSTDIQALPGTLDTQIDGKKGKLGLKAAFYVSASEDGEPLQGKVKIGFATSKDRTKNAGNPLGTGLTSEAISGSVIPLQGAIITSIVIQAIVLEKIGDLDNEVEEITEEIPLSGETFFGVGDVLTDLGCVRACVKDQDGDAVAHAQVTATAISPALSGSEYTDAEGCVAVTLPKSPVAAFPVQVRVVAEAGSWQGNLNIQPAGSIENPGSCQALQDITLTQPQDSNCPRGYLVCGEACRDPFVHSDCEGSGDGGTSRDPDAGGGPDDMELDGSIGMADAGVSVPDGSTGVPDSGDDLPDASTGPVYYVDRDNGQVGNTGTVGSPLPNISAALALLASGSNGEIRVAPGTYDEGAGELFPLILPETVDLVQDPNNLGLATIWGGEDYEGTITAVVVGSSSRLEGFTVESSAGVDHYGVVVDGRGTVANNRFTGQNGVRIVFHNPDILDNEFSTEIYGINGCHGGLVEGNAFRSGATQIETSGIDLCLIWDNDFTGAGDFGILVSGSAAPHINNNRFSVAAGYSLAAISIDNDTSVRIRDNDFSAIGAGTIIHTVSGSTGKLDMGTIENVPLNHFDSPGNNIFPDDEPTPFSGQRVQVEGYRDAFGYGNDWGGGRTELVCGADVRSEGGGYMFYSDVTCNFAE